MGSAKWLVPRDILCTFAMGVFCVMFGVRDVECAVQNSESKKRAGQERLAKRYTDVFGAQVSFIEHLDLVMALRMIGPQAVERRLPLDQIAVDPGVVRWSRSVLQQLWFKKEWVPTDEEATPVAVTPLSESPFDEATLHYTWTRDDVRVLVTESSGGILLELANPKFDFREGIPRESMAEFLETVCNFRDHPKWGSVTAQLQIPELIKNGAVFGSMRHEQATLFFEFWPRVVKIFCANDRVYVILLRPNRVVRGKGPRGEERTGVGLVPVELGHYWNPKWLDGAILEADGKTPIPMEKLSKLAVERERKLREESSNPRR